MKMRIADGYLQESEENWSAGNPLVAFDEAVDMTMLTIFSYLVMEGPQSFVDLIKRFPEGSVGGMKIAVMELAELGYIKIGFGL